MSDTYEYDDNLDYDVDWEADIEEIEETEDIEEVEEMEENVKKKTGGWDGVFNGTYETSRYADGTLETDILNAGRGIWATKDGGLYRETNDRIDIWKEGDGKGNYDHYYYNGPTDYGKAPDGRHKE